MATGEQYIVEVEAILKHEMEPTANDLVATTEQPPQVYHDVIEIPGVRYTLVALHLIAILLAGLGNGSVVYFIVKYRRLRTNVTAFLVLNLAVCDFIGATMHQPMRLIDILVPFSSHNGTVKITQTYCQVTGFFSSFFAGVGFHTVLAISQERFLLICFPLQAKGLLTVGKTIKVIIGIWVLSFLVLLPLPIGYTYIAHLQLEGANMTFCMSDFFSDRHQSGRMYYLFLFFLYFAIPVVVISGTYIKIFHTLSQTLQGTDPTDRIVEKVMKSRRNLAFVMLLIAAVFSVLHAPYFVTFLFVSLGYAIPKNPIFTLLIIEFLPLLNAVFNPFIYSAHSRTFFKRKMISFLSTADPEESLHKRATSELTVNSLQMTGVNKPDHIWINGSSDPKGDVQV